MFIIQLIGGIGYLLLALSYFKKDKKDILFMQILSYIAFTVHYYLLSGITGSLCNLTGLFAFIVIFIFEKCNMDGSHEHEKKYLLYLVLPFIIVVPLISYENIFSIFPVLASISVIISFLFKDENKIRTIGLFSAVCWLIYAIVYKSYVAIVFEVITLIFVLIALIKSLKEGYNDRYRNK